MGEADDRKRRQKTRCEECGATDYSIKSVEEGRLLCARCREEGWQDTALYCPHCGRQGLQQELDPGDYYLGGDYRCRGCKKVVKLP